MTAKLTTTATRAYYADAISDAIADAEKILGSLVVTSIECVLEPDYSPRLIGYYKATVESTWSDR